MDPRYGAGEGAWNCQLMIAGKTILVSAYLRTFALYDT